MTNAAIITGDFSGYVYNSFSNLLTLGHGFADGKRVTGTFTINTALAQVVDRDQFANSAQYEDIDLNDNWIDIQWQLQDFDVEGALVGTASYDKVNTSTSSSKDYIRLQDYNVIPSPTGDTYVSKSFFIEEYEDDILSGIGIAQSFSWKDAAQGCGDVPNTYVRCAFFNFTQRGGGLPWTYVNAWLDSVTFHGEQDNTPTDVSAPASILITALGLVGLVIRRRTQRG
jgi:hypothetical protein